MKWCRVGKLAIFLTVCGLSHLVSAQEANKLPLISQVKRSVLSEVIGTWVEHGADENGAVFTFHSPQGLRDDFHLGVQPSSEEAKRVLQAWPAPEQSEVVTLENVAEAARGWRLKSGSNAQKETYRIAARRFNVVFAFDWRGTLVEAIAFAKKMDTALQNNAALAPRGVVEGPHLEAIAPALVTVGQPFTLLYRSNPQRYISPAPTLRITPVGTSDKAFTLPLSEARPMSMSGKTQVTLPEPGRYELSVTCVGENGPILRAVSNVRAVDDIEAKHLNDASPWILPNKALYFTPRADVKWAALPEGEREQIQLQKRSMSTDLNGKDTNWVRLQAWNDLASMLSPRFLPDPEMLRVFETSTATARFNVTYVTYQRENANLILMQEVGRRVWLYVETTPGNDTPRPLETLLPDWKTDAASGHLFMARTLTRYRGLTLDGPFDPVKILFLRAEQDSQVNLNFPGYP